MNDIISELKYIFQFLHIGCSNKSTIVSETIGPMCSRSPGVPHTSSGPLHVVGQFVMPVAH